MDARVKLAHDDRLDQIEREPLQKAPHGSAGPGDDTGAFGPSWRRGAWLQEAKLRRRTYLTAGSLLRGNAPC